MTFSDNSAMREEQAQHGRTKLGLSGPRRQSVNSSGGRSTFKPKGHDAILKSIQDDGRSIVVEFQDGTEVSGKLIARDRYTIAVRNEDGTELTIYKSSIRLFYAVQ